MGLWIRDTSGTLLAASRVKTKALRTEVRVTLRVEGDTKISNPQAIKEAKDNSRQTQDKDIEVRVGTREGKGRVTEGLRDKRKRMMTTDMRDRSMLIEHRLVNL